MERSAINAYAAAGAFLGLLFGLWASNTIVGTDNPGRLFSLAALLATPFAAGAWWLISRRYAKAGPRERRFHAIFGWVVLLACAVAALAGVDAMFPKAATA